MALEPDERLGNPPVEDRLSPEAFSRARAPQALAASSPTQPVSSRLRASGRRGGDGTPSALDGRLGKLLRQADSAPFEIKRIRQDLADQELDEKSLAAELDSRLKYARIQKANEFYILLDTKRRQFAFKYGDKVVRETSFDAGAPRIIQAKNGARWTFARVTGAFTVKEKLEKADWKVPEWVYILNPEKPPDPLPTVPAGLGRYVLVFSDGYLIHSPPPPESPLSREARLLHGAGSGSVGRLAPGGTRHPGLRVLG